MITYDFDHKLILLDALRSERVRMAEHIRKGRHNGSERAVKRLSALEEMVIEISAGNGETVVRFTR